MLHHPFPHFHIQYHIIYIHSYPEADVVIKVVKRKELPGWVKDDYYAGWKDLRAPSAPHTPAAGVLSVQLTAPMFSNTSAAAAEELAGAFSCAYTAQCYAMSLSFSLSFSLSLSLSFLCVCLFFYLCICACSILNCTTVCSSGIFLRLAYILCMKEATRMKVCPGFAMPQRM